MKVRETQRKKIILVIRNKNSERKMLKKKDIQVGGWPGAPAFFKPSAMINYVVLQIGIWRGGKPWVNTTDEPMLEVT